MLGHYVYLHCTPDGTPFYVGEGAMKRVKKIVGARNKLHSEIVKNHGKENILIYAFLCESKEDSLNMEALWIKQLREQGIILANFNNGGHGGAKHSPESRAAISKAKIGKHISEAHKASIRETLKGRKLSPCHCESLSDGVRKKWESDDFREKMSIAQKARWASYREKKLHIGA